MTGYRLISSDSHVFEPPDLWEKRIDPEYRARAPRLVHEAETDQWYSDGDIKFGIVGSNSQAGERFESPENIRREGRYEDARPGGMDPQAHVEDMDVDGVVSGVLYPSMGLTVYRVPSPDLLSAIFRAYNDWLADFCAPYPDRLKGIAMINVDSVAEGVAELRRAKGIGLAGAMIPQRPQFGRYDHSMYEPLWAAAEELEMPLSLHVDTNRWRSVNERAGIFEGGLVESVNNEYNMKDNVAAMLLCGMFERYPNLKVGAVEYEVLWAPYMLRRLDTIYHDRPRNFDFRYAGDAVPSDFFRRNMFVSFQEDALGMQLREYTGVETLMWASDYPHAESTFPRSKQIVEEILEGIPEDEKGMIAGENCARVYGIK